MRLGMIYVAAATLALTVAGCGDDQGNNVAPPPGGQKVAAIAPPAGSDWTQVVTETPDGGFRMGNPNAPVKLLEYGSFGCGHCAQFEAEAAGPLEDYVKSGRVSREFRSFLIFPADPGISLLTRCHGPDAFFLLTRQLYATQGDWMRKMQEKGEQLQSLSPDQLLKPVIQAAELDAFFRQRGMPQAKIDACLDDKAAIGRVLAISRRGSEELEVGGTPSFFINGVKLPLVDTWAKLEPQLKRALGE